jgi:hypothetical protein
MPSQIPRLLFFSLLATSSLAGQDDELLAEA